MKKVRIAAVLLVCLCGVLSVAFFMFLSKGETPPTFLEVKEAYRPSDGILLDRHGEPLQEIRSEFRERVLPWVPIEEISPLLVEAVLRSEDKRFFRHPGVDIIALLSAMHDNLERKRLRGASTITMQLSDLLAGLDTGAMKKSGKFAAKVRQARSALLVERRWSKREIMEAYLNSVSFRGELVGIAAASRGMFDKEPGGLDAAESTLLACLLRSPNALPSVVARRAQWLCNDLGWDVSEQKLASLAGERLRAPFHVRSRYGKAFHATRLLSPGPGEKVKSTLDAGIQQFAADAVAQRIASIAKQNVRDGAVLVVENATGEILAYVGSAGGVSKNPFVDGARAKRQAGSTLKPFIYGAAFEKRLLTPASLLDDSPMNLPTERGLYVPRNYDSGFRGLVSARTALASSLNIPAVRAILVVGADEAVRVLSGFRFTLSGEGEDYGPSLALGSADVSLVELVGAYRALANGGRWSPMTLRLSESGTPPKRAMLPEAAFLVSDILSDRTARGETFGLANSLSTTVWSAVKTGTSKDMRDNWCIGYSSRYTVGVWVGNFSGEPMWDVSGVSGAAPAWADIMRWLHTDASSVPPRPPPGLVKARVVFHGGLDEAREEWFVSGTEPASGKVAAVSPAAAIRYPVDGMIMAFDPDIPEGQQVVFFEASGKGLSWVLDGVLLGQADAPYPWKLSVGTHSLSLVDRDGKTAQTVAFQVRGSQPPLAALVDDAADAFGSHEMDAR